MSDLEQLDADNRIRALELQSFIIEAPAGAGKTELLTQRYLKLLSTVGEPEEIIALTFTNKAETEMRNRILQSLLDAENNTEVTKPHKLQTRSLAKAALNHASKSGWQLLTQPSRLRILTMDALCSSLARQMPLLSRLGGQPKVSEDTSLHYAEAAQRALAQVAQEASLQAPVSAALSFMNNDIEKLSSLLADMLEKREQWLHLAGQHTALTDVEITEQCQLALKECIEEKLEAALQVFPASYQAMLMPAARFAASNLEDTHEYAKLLDWQEPIEAHVDELSSWLALRKFFFKQDKNFRTPDGLNTTFGFPLKNPNSKAHIQTFVDVCASIADPSALEALGKLPVVSEDDLHENSAIIQAFAQLLQQAAAHLWTVFQAANEVDFVAIAQSAIYALSNDQGATDLALKLDYKVSHLLVDEFQDTNATQMALLQQLTQGWEPQDSRTLFCVGDPMQSIYRFRKADVSLFLQATEYGIGQVPLKSLKLTTNNRSQPKVVEWVNQTFKTIFPADDNEIEAAISYRPFIAKCDLGEDEGVSVHPLVVENDEESENAKALEAQYVANLIEKERVKNPAQIIAVLTRSRKHLHPLISEIRRNFSHIKFQTVKFEQLAQRQTVQDALSLTRSLLHRADRVHWLNILRAPWCGLTLTDLHALCADDHRETVWKLMEDDARIATLSADGQKRLMHVKNVLGETFVAQGRMPLRRWLETAWIKLGGVSTLINVGDNRDVQAFFDLVEKLAQGSALDFGQLETAMSKLYAEPDIEADGKLLFLTIQESKGLEFDCVILPALNRKPPNPDSPLMLWENVPVDGKAQLIAAPFSRKNKNGALSIYDYIKQLEATRSNNEMARLLYVAATRTKRKLHLIATIKHSEAEIKPAANSFLSLLWPALANDFLQAGIVKSETQIFEKLSEFMPKLMRLPTPTSPQILTLHHVATSNFSPSIESAKQSTLNLAADCGTLAHLYMEMIANTGLDHWPVSKINNASPAMCKWLQQRGHNAKNANQAASEVLAALTTSTQSEDGKWVLQQRETQYAEFSLTTTDATHVIDRTFIENGERWIIDYKSVRLDEGLAAKELNQQAENYRLQLERYAELFKDEGLPIRKGVFFMALGKLAELS